MTITSLLLMPLLFLLPGLAFFTLPGRSSANPAAPGQNRHAGVADLIFLSIACSGWVAQTLTLAGRFTMPVVTLSVIVLSLVVLFARHSPSSCLRDVLRSAGAAARPSVAGALALAAILLLAAMLYQPPGITMLSHPTALPAHSLGIHLARTGSLPQPDPGPGLAGAPEAMREAAGSGLFFPCWIGLLHLLGGTGWSGAAPGLFAALSLAVIFCIGRWVTGSSWFGAGLLLALGLNYPQAWLARVSVPESAAQFLVLSSALFYLRSRDGFPGLPAAAVSLGAAALCSRALLWFIPPALLLLLALQVSGPAEERRRAARFALMTLPFLAQGWLQAMLLGGEGGNPPLPGGSAHWMIWYLTLPFTVLLACGLLLMLARPAASLGFIAGLGPLFPLALVSLFLLLCNPGSAAVQPWAARPFTVALIPVCLLVALLFFHGTLERLHHPALRVIWCTALAAMLGLNLANLMPMATSRPGHGARSLVNRAAAPLAAGQRPYTAVVEPGLGSLGLHTGLAGGHGIRSLALRGDHLDRERFQALVRDNAAAGHRTALVVSEGEFFPDPAAVTLLPLATAVEKLRFLPPEADHLPSSVISRPLRLQIFEALPAENTGAPAGRSPLTVRVGLYREDWSWLVSGFRETTTAGGRPHRWTGSLARLRVPSWSAEVELTVGGFRPPGAPAAVISAGFAGRLPVSRQLPREGFVTVLVPHPPRGPDQPPAILELHSSCFHPESWFTGSDGEPLGLQLAAITFRPAGQ